MAIQSHLHIPARQPSTASQSYWLFGRALRIPTQRLFRLFCRGTRTTSARAEEPALLAPRSWLQPPASTWLPCQALQSGWQPQERMWRALSGGLLWGLPPDRIHWRSEGWPQGQQLFPFLPQLVTQGSSVHGLSNKLTSELKHTIFPFYILDFALCLLLGVKVVSSNKMGQGQSAQLLGIGSLEECAGNPWALPQTAVRGPIVVLIMLPLETECQAL